MSQLPPLPPIPELQERDDERRDVVAMDMPTVAKNDQALPDAPLPKKQDDKLPELPKLVRQDAAIDLPELPKLATTDDKQLSLPDVPSMSGDSTEIGDPRKLEEKVDELLEMVREMKDKLESGEYFKLG